MKIEIYRTTEDRQDFSDEIKRLQRENLLGCLTSGLVLLIGLYILLALLPFLLVFIGITIVCIGVIVIYKLYFESAVLNFIQKMRMKRQQSGK